MNKLREALRLITGTDMSNRLIGRTLCLSHTTISRYRTLAIKKELDSDRLAQMDDVQLERLIQADARRMKKNAVPDFDHIYKEMQYPHMTRQLAWEEYRLENPENCYGISQFNKLYREYLGKLDLSMRQTHRAGEITFVDFAGRTVPYFDVSQDAELSAQIFVAVIGCSNYGFAYAVKSQKIPDWIEAHNQMFKYFGGMTQVVVPDNLKSAVDCAGKEPKINRTYLELAKHYSVAIVPARVRRPKDKSKAEKTVDLVYKWILARLRHRKFFSLDEINQAIRELLIQFNERPFKKLPGCRRSRFEEFDQPLLRPLPSEPFEYAEWTSSRKLNADYHACIQGHYYSAPHELVGSYLEARVTTKTIELFNKGRRVASHPRSYEVGGHTTNEAHLLDSHRRYAQQRPDLIVKWARSIGEATEAVIQHQFDSKPHEMLAIQSCSSLQRLAKSYGSERFEAACRRAQQIRSLTTKSVRSILQHGLENIQEETLSIQMKLPLHDNLRGPDYYTMGGK